MNKHKVFIGLTLVQTILLMTLFLQGAARIKTFSEGQQPALEATVATLQLTDLALWTEARYTRHPSQADHFTPFQDLPSALEHFPAGSILAPVKGKGVQP